MSSKVLPSSIHETNFEQNDESSSVRLLPLKEIPGSYGIPFITPIKDRLDFYYFKGRNGFFQSKIDSYGSTVFRTNVPPGPFMASHPGVIAVLDAKSFPVLFDMTKVEKKDVFTGTYMPTTKLTGGYRVCSYLDPTEPKHAQIKQFLFNLLASRKDAVIPAFHSAYAIPLFSSLESNIASSGSADFTSLNDTIAFDFLGEAYFGSRPSKTGLQSKITTWLAIQLAPLLSNIITKFIPWPIEDLLFHTFPLPSIVAKPGYKQLYAYFQTAGSGALDAAVKLGLSRDEACHNLLFATCFNTYGGLKILFPSIVTWLAQTGPALHARLASEARAAVEQAGDNGRVTLAALDKMYLNKSVVYETLRIDPPVQFQYGHARTDFVLESHDASFQVRKGEMLFGYQPIATRDARVFGATADKFVPDRFLGDGAKLVPYVWWSNGPETESPTLANKQCAGKDFVVLVARLFVAELFLQYDSFTAKVGTSPLGTQVTITSVTKAEDKVVGPSYN
ncbi:hypothetical protein HPP92_022769 [Vanilla planifolia]|uniref:Allene oxide synthase n=1 Tax=Vanilla planifolia TaxID=51239 RepID=A0A835UHJ3_VANPL|nr:hypothetical protein HPP92_022769 [Vanilla planifolia]